MAATANIEVSMKTKRLLHFRAFGYGIGLVMWKFTSPKAMQGGWHFRWVVA